jgi:hypothetical protein
MDKNVLIDKIMIGTREIDKHISAIKNFMISSIFKIEYNIKRVSMIENQLLLENLNGQKMAYIDCLKKIKELKD